MFLHQFLMDLQRSLMFPFGFRKKDLNDFFEVRVTLINTILRMRLRACLTPGFSTGPKLLRTAFGFLDEPQQFRG